MADILEHEMLDRLVDGTRTAADAVLAICQDMRDGRPAMPSKLAVFKKQLNAAAASAHQLAHAQANPDFMLIRDQLDEAARGILSLSFSNDPRAAMVLSVFGNLLDRLWHDASKMVRARAVTRQDVLGKLDLREAVVKQLGAHPLSPEGRRAIANG